MKLDPNKIPRKLSSSLLTCLLETPPVSEKPNLQSWQCGYLIIAAQEANISCRKSKKNCLSLQKGKENLCLTHRLYWWTHLNHCFVQELAKQWIEKENNGSTRQIARQQFVSVYFPIISLLLRTPTVQPFCCRKYTQLKSLNFYNCLELKTIHIINFFWTQF